jgi:type II secretory pathway component GspD/PulD (secretin)
MSPHASRLRLSALTAAAITALALLTLPGAVRADGEALDRKVDVALADSAPDQAFAGLAKMIGLESAVEPGLDGKVTVRLQNVRMRTVLDAVCESIGCTWSVVPGTPAKLRILPLAERSARKAVVLDAPIDLKVTKADVREVLQTFGQIMSAAVELDPQISGKVSLELDNIPVGKALDAVCAAAACDWKLDGDGERSVLRITARK